MLSQELKAYVDKVNQILAPWNFQVEAPTEEGEFSRLAVAWEATVRLAAAVRRLELRHPVAFEVSANAGGASAPVVKSAGTMVVGVLTFYLNPNSVIVPTNKSSTMAFLMVKRAAHALADALATNEVAEAKEEIEERAAFEIKTFQEIYKAYRYKKVNPAWDNPGLRYQALREQGG